MNNSVVNQISSKVYDQFPETAGVRPKIKAQNREEGIYLLLYKTEAALPAGRKIKRIVRVVVNESGHVLKLSTSKG